MIARVVAQNIRELFAVRTPLNVLRPTAGESAGGNDLLDRKRLLLWGGLGGSGEAGENQDKSWFQRDSPIGRLATAAGKCTPIHDQRVLETADVL